jgi:hypothetical protein
MNRTPITPTDPKAFWELQQAFLLLAAQRPVNVPALAAIVDAQRAALAAR